MVAQLQQCREPRVIQFIYSSTDVLTKHKLQELLTLGVVILHTRQSPARPIFTLDQFFSKSNVCQHVKQVSFVTPYQFP